MDKVKNVFSGETCSNWDNKSSLIKQIDGDDNYIKEILTESVFRGCRLLDVGCGTGKLSKWISNQVDGIDVTGIDISMDMISCAKKHTRSNCQFYVMDVEKEDLNLDGFDFVIMKQSLHHMVNRNDVFRRIYSVLNDQGKLLIMTPSENYQSDLIDFTGSISDPLGRMTEDYLKQLLFNSSYSVTRIVKKEFNFHFESAIDYINFMYRIGSIQKICCYEQKIFNVVLKLVHSILYRQAKEEFSFSGEYLYVEACKA